MHERLKRLNINIGDRFGHWTVLEEAEPQFKEVKSGKYKGKFVKFKFFKCQCDCGKINTIRASHLISGESNSCRNCAKREEIIPGRVFGNLTILHEVEFKNDERYFRCRCKCGNEVEVALRALKSGNTKSCGCLRQINHRKTHGETKTRLYKVWRGIKDRCYDSKHISYKLYGGRGIRMCDEWVNDFKAFRDWAYATGYKEEVLPNNKNKWTIDRIDPNGNYCSENCRWVTNEEQQKNKRNSKRN